MVICVWVLTLLLHMLRSFFVLDQLVTLQIFCLICLLSLIGVVSICRQHGQLIGFTKIGLFAPTLLRLLLLVKLLLGLTILLELVKYLSFHLKRYFRVCIFFLSCLYICLTRWAVFTYLKS